MNNFLIACGVSFIARVLTHPFDTLKTLQQIQTVSASSEYIDVEPPSLWETAEKVVRRDGLSCLFRGLGVTLLFSVPALAVYMTSYDACKDFLEKHWHLDASSVIVFLISATFAESLSGFFWTRMERLKAKQQAELHESDFELALDDDDSLMEQDDIMGLEGVTYPRPHLEWQEPSSAWQIAKNIYKDDGWTGFFRGYWLGLAVYIPHSMIYFTLYEEPIKLKDFGRYLGLGSSAVIYFGLASGLAAAVAAFFSNAADMIKTRWQVFSNNEHRTVLQLIDSMWRNGGPRIFFQGAGARVLWAVPNIMISFTLYEILKIPQ